MITSLRIPSRFQRYRLRFLAGAGRTLLGTVPSVNAWKRLFMSYFQSGLVVVIIWMRNFQHILSVHYVASFTCTGGIDQYRESFWLIQPDSVPSATLTTYCFNKLVNLILILNMGNVYRAGLPPTAFCSHLCTTKPTRRITVLTPKNVKFPSSKHVICVYIS